jgi:hypothetical protein
MSINNTIITLMVDPKQCSQGKYGYYKGEDVGAREYPP